jgi:iron complex outermembrane recepter protein
MNTHTHKYIGIIITLIALLSISLRADTTPTGSVIGRIQNGETEEYIYGARVQVVATADATTGQTVATSGARYEISDQSGSFHVDGLPVGQVTLAVTYLGMPTQTVSATVVAGREVAIPDVQLRHTRTGNEVVKLDAYQVSVAKDMSNREIAINTQKYADNLKSVVAVDDLGFIADGSIANAMKFIPGVDMETDSYGYGATISMSGAPSSSVPISFGGFSMTTSSDNSQDQNGAGSPGTGSPGNGGSAAVRSTQLMSLSLNNISRIEVNHTTLPDDPGTALAGSVNFVPKSAFELSHPEYQFALYGVSQQNELTKSSILGPDFKTIRSKFPGFNYSAVVPVNKKFGFSVNFSTNSVPKYTQTRNLYWNADWNTTTGTYLSTPLNPTHYFLNYEKLDNIMTVYKKTNINFTADYKVSPHGTLSATFTQGYNVMGYSDNYIRWGSTGDINLAISTLANEIGSTNTSGSSANNNPYGPLPTTNLTLYPGINNNAQLGVGNSVTSEVRDEANKQMTLKYHYDYNGWKINFGNSYGSSRKQTRNLDANSPEVFNSFYNLRPLASFQLNGVNANGFTSAVAVAANGAVVNPADINTFVAAGGFITTYTYANGVSSPNTAFALPPERVKPMWASDHTFQSQGDFARDLKSDGSIFRNIPTSIKIGYDFKEYSREQRLDPTLGNNGQGFMYLGNLPQSSFTIPYPNTYLGGFGGGSSQEISNALVGQYWVKNPSLFAAGRPYSDYSANIQYNNRIEERIASTYIRADSKFLKGRLKIAYGIRLERTMDNGVGPLIKNNGKTSYVTNSAGQILDTQSGLTKGTVYIPNGTDPYTLTAMTPLLNPSQNTVAWAQTIFTQLASFSSHNYNNYFPSATASYNVTNDLIARLSFSQTIGRPDYNSLYPSLQTPDETQPPASNNQFTLNNIGLKPWVSHNYGASLEYYAPDGLWNVTLRAYRRFVANSWTTGLTLSADQGSAILNQYGYNPAEWAGYTVTTALNVPSVITTSGLELSGNLSFDKTLPPWAHGLALRFGGTRATQTGGGIYAPAFAAQNLALIPWSAGAGLSLTRSRFQIAVNGKWDSIERLTYNDYTTGSGQYDPNTYTYQLATLHIDLDLSFRLTKVFSLFVNGRDINGYNLTLQRFSPTTPDYAKNYTYYKYQPVWTLGMKAKF